MSKHDYDPAELTFPIWLEMYNQHRGFNTSQPQYKLAEWLQDTDNDPYRIMHAYRHCGKSDLTCLWVVWKLVQDPNWSVLICSGSHNVSKRNSSFIRTVIGSFLPATHLKPKAKELWQRDQFTVDRNRVDLSPSVQVTSVGSSNTGIHADVFLGDDVEVAENVRTAEAREYLWDRIQEFQALCSRQLYVGTPHDEETIYQKLLELPFPYTRILIPVRDLRGKPANPDVAINGEIHNEEWIARKEGSMTTGRFASQYMLEARKSYDVLFAMELINFFDDRVKVEEVRDPTAIREVSYLYSIEHTDVKDIVAYWDPAKGALARSDDSVLAIIASTVKGDIYVLHIQVLSPVEKGMTFDQQCTEVIDACQAHGVDTVTVEVNFSPTLANDLKKTARKMKRRIRVKEHDRKLKGKIPFIAETLEPVIKTGRFNVYLPLWEDTPLKGQLEDFPKGKHDDVLDAIAGAIDSLKVPKQKAGDKSPDTPFRQPRSSMVINKPGAAIGHIPGKTKPRLSAPH